MKRFPLTTSVLSTVLLAAVAIAVAWSQDRATREVSYCDLSLGMSDSEVLHIKGRPQELLGDAEYDENVKGYSRHMTPLSELRPPKTIRDFPVWHYSPAIDGSFYIAVRFNKEDRQVASIACFSQRHSTCPSAAGVPIGASEEFVTARLGPGIAKIDGAAKVISYPDLNVTCFLERQEVYMIIVSGNTHT